MTLHFLTYILKRWKNITEVLNIYIYTSETAKDLNGTTLTQLYFFATKIV